MRPLHTALALLFGIAFGEAAAQQILPSGVALVQLGFRGYGEQSEGFDGDGLKEPLGAKFDKSFRGADLARGKGGAQLKKLVDELKKFEATHPENQGLANGLDLGTLRGDVRADVKAVSLGFAAGVTRRLTLFVGAPWIRAVVESRLSMSGDNNARAIKDQLGELAYDELKSGLDRAAALDASAVQKSLEGEMGYAAIDRWEKQDLGDLRLGGRTMLDGRVTRGLRWSLPVTTTLLLPTGAVDDPDVLTDFGFGRGYFGAGLAVEPRVTAWGRFFAVADLSYVKNFETKRRARLPQEGEELAASERTFELELDPGDDARYGSGVGVILGPVTLSVKSGVERHFADRYDGDERGNYAALARGSDQTAVYVEGAVSVSTVEWYRRGSFPLPTLMTFTVHDVPQGTNVVQTRSFELNVAGFLKAR